MSINIKLNLTKFLSVVQIFSLLLFLSNFHIFIAREFKEQNKNFQINGPFLEEDYGEMRIESEKIINFLRNNSGNFTDVPINYNSMKEQLRVPNNHTDSIICKFCLSTFKTFHSLLKEKYGLVLLNEFLTIFCTIGLNYNICKQAIELYSPTVVDSLIEHYFDAQFMCTKLHICKYSHYIEMNPDDYARDLLKDKPIKNKTDEVDRSASTWKILHITDLHTDLKYNEGSVGLCPEPLCCREVNGKAKTNEQYAGRWGFPGKCDIPLLTLDLFIETVVNEINPDFIIWTGDNPPHNPWKSNAEEIYNITEIFIDLLYDKYNYRGHVFPALGNHEEYIADQYNPYEIAREKDFLKKMGDMFKRWLTDEEHQLFLKTGYYSKKYLNSNLRIIALNCFLCDIMNFFLISNPTDPGKQFEWLESVLRSAEINGEYVIIIGHIPPGDSTYMSECSKRYNAIVDRFSHIIRGQFYGHTHYDEYRVITEYFNNTNIAGLVFTSPSLTTYSWQNPSFRVYEMDSNTKILKDYTQYRLNITKANLTPDIKPKWEIAYKAKDIFKTKHLNDYEPFRQMINNILEDKSLLDVLLDNFFAQGIEKQYYESNKNIGKYIACRFNQSVFDEYFSCTKYKTWDYIEYVTRFIEIFSGRWFVKIDDFENSNQEENKFLYY